MEKKTSIIVSAFSDLHGNLIDIPKCDLAFMCGDFSPVQYDRNLIAVAMWIQNFMIPWLKEQKKNYDKFIFIAGNHDFICDSEEWKDWFQNQLKENDLEDSVIYLEDSTYNYKGIDIYGCPHSEIYGWAFYSGDYKDYIPSPQADIMLVHAAPNIGGLGDTILGGYSRSFGSNCLVNGITTPCLNLQYLFCGHIHGGNHKPYKHENITMYNVSILDEQYQVHYEPLTTSLCF